MLHAPRFSYDYMVPSTKISIKPWDEDHSCQNCYKKAEYNLTAAANELKHLHANRLTNFARKSRRGHKGSKRPHAITLTHKQTLG